MGGMCNAEISGNTPEEMMTNGMKHVEAAHPDMAADIKKMPKDDPKMVEWSANFMKTWMEAPEK